jgi:hypothetical protein
MLPTTTGHSVVDNTSRHGLHGRSGGGLLDPVRGHPFLYFCDVALFLTLIGLWTRNRLLLSMSAVGILISQALWCADFAAHFVGLKVTGMTDYMCDSQRSLSCVGLQ